jgi:hypothetical protein
MDDRCKLSEMIPRLGLGCENKRQTLCGVWFRLADTGRCFKLRAWLFQDSSPVHWWSGPVRTTPRLASPLPKAKLAFPQSRLARNWIKRSEPGLKRTIRTIASTYAGAWPDSGSTSKMKISAFKVK